MLISKKNRKNVSNTNKLDSKLNLRENNSNSLKRLKVLLSSMSKRKPLASQINDEFTFIDYAEKIDNSLRSYLYDLNEYTNFISQISNKYIDPHQNLRKGFRLRNTFKSTKSQLIADNSTQLQRKTLNNFYKVSIPENQELNPKIIEKDKEINIGQINYSPPNKFFREKSLKTFKQKYQIMINLKQIDNYRNQINKSILQTVISNGIPKKELMDQEYFSPFISVSQKLNRKKKQNKSNNPIFNK